MSNIINRINLLTSFLFQKTTTSGLPVEIGIELTNQCNLSCIMCPHPEMVKKKIRPLGFMSEPLFKKIIDEVVPFAELVYLHGLGESFIHPKVFDFIRYAKSRGIAVGISTNATLLDKKGAKKLIESGIDYVILAIDGATKNTYEAIRKGANFEQVEKNIKTFLKLKKNRSKSPFTVLQFITMPENEKEMRLFTQKWSQMGADAIRIKPKIALKFSDKKRNLTKKPYCFHIFRQLNITWDGLVMACCEDVFASFPLGNVKKEKIKDLWNNKKMQLLRKINFKRQQDKVNICKNCSYPQPTRLQALGALIFNHLTVKKMLPYLEKYFSLSL